MSQAMRKRVLCQCDIDQPAHLRSLISTFVVRCLDSIIHLLAIAESSRPQLVSAAEQAGLSINWSETLKTGFLVTWLKYNRTHITQNNEKYDKLILPTTSKFSYISE